MNSEVNSSSWMSDVENFLVTSAFSGSPFERLMLATKLEGMLVFANFSAIVFDVVMGMLLHLYEEVSYM